jgi:hypothetical protein
MEEVFGTKIRDLVAFCKSNDTELKISKLMIINHASLVDMDSNEIALWNA